MERIKVKEVVRTSMGDSPTVKYVDIYMNGKLSPS
jgi:hypothetical protein